MTESKLNPTSLDRSEVLTHSNIISKYNPALLQLPGLARLVLCIPCLEIGEKIRLQVAEDVEDSKQRAIRCTKEVVEREQTQIREDELSRAREAWKSEKQQLYQEAHQNQLRAIAGQTGLLEDRLREEFQDRLTRIEEEHQEYMELTVQNTWEKARVIREKAVADTRLEEQQYAAEEARRVAERVAQEKVEEKEQAEREKARALEEHTQYMKELQRNALGQQRRELDNHYAAKTKDLTDQYESRMAELRQHLGEETADNQQLRTDLQEMTESRDSWELQYRNLKIEFADFIDQFPGFRAEFILK